MKSKKSVPQVFDKQLNPDAFLPKREGPGKEQKPKPLHRRFKNKHGRQHP